MQSVGGRKKYWANAFFKKKFMANEWVEKKSYLQQITQPSPSLLPLGPSEVKWLAHKCVRTSFIFYYLFIFFIFFILFLFFILLQVKHTQKKNKNYTINKVIKTKNKKTNKQTNSEFTHLHGNILTNIKIRYSSANSIYYST